MIDPKDFLDPVDIEINGQKFKYSRIPAFYAADIYDEIIANKGVIPQNTRLKILERCAVETDKGIVSLDKPVLVNEYVKHFQTLRTLMDKMIEYNFGFFPDESNSQE